jgi:hypothetical protein
MVNMRKFIREAENGRVVTDNNHVFVADHMQGNGLTIFQNAFPPLWIANCVLAGHTGILGDLLSRG